jgi:hypothetical protein
MATPRLTKGLIILDYLGRGKELKAKKAILFEPKVEEEV